ILMGVTGSGKSVAWDEPVLIRCRRPDGTHEVVLTPIGKLIDAAFADSSASGNPCPKTELIAPLCPIEALSFNPTTYQAEWRAITTFSRHPAPAQMYCLRTDCGREVVVTGDHNFFSL